MWPLFLIPILSFAPESPWHLVRKGRFEESEAVLRRLQDDDCPTNPKDTVVAIHHVNSLEEQLSVGTSQFEALEAVTVRRTN